ncbi:MAG: hypothetical protein IJY93_01990 [Clostridia bacterium]|nr:hypothetical protein [Clostridia bacterium]
MKKVIAKILRILTIPPLLVTALLSVIYFTRDTTFRGLNDYLAAVICLAVIPALAYPLQPIIPGFKGKGRDGQRELAFVMSTIGYIVGFAYAFISNAPNEFKFIIAAYLLSVILLLIFNKIFHLKASGHACGVLGPLLFAVYFLGPIWVIPCSIVAACVAWSSVALSRHTPKDLCLGGVCALTAFITMGIGIL